MYSAEEEVCETTERVHHTNRRSLKENSVFIYSLARHFLHSASGEHKRRNSEEDWAKFTNEELFP